jgi:hypothetical protein
MPDMTSPARTYAVRTVLFLGGYIAVNLAAMTGAFDDLRRPGAVLFALAATGPVVGHVWSLLAYMRDADEFLGALMARRFVVATGLCLALVTGWGLMEVYADAAHFPPVLLYPMLWAAFALVTPFIRSTRRCTTD